MTDTTIRDVRVTLVRTPWPDTPDLQGLPFKGMRDLVVVEIETASGISGMGYLHLLNSPVLRTIGTCIEETITPLILGRDATAVEAIWSDLWRATLTAGRGGITTMAMSAIDIALWDIVGKAANMPLHLVVFYIGLGLGLTVYAAAPSVGPLPFRNPNLWQRLFPPDGRRRNDRQGPALRCPGLQGHQDAGRACA